MAQFISSKYTQKGKKLWVFLYKPLTSIINLLHRVLILFFFLYTWYVMLVCKIKSRIPKCLLNIFYTPVLFLTKWVFTCHEPDFLIGTSLDLPRHKPNLESQARKKAKNNYNSQNLITKSEGSRSTGPTFARRIPTNSKDFKKLAWDYRHISYTCRTQLPKRQEERRLIWSREFKGEFLRNIFS